jgi:hypothetical protein
MQTETEPTTTAGTTSMGPVPCGPVPGFTLCRCELQGLVGVDMVRIPFCRELTTPVYVAPRAGRQSRRGQ